MDGGGSIACRAMVARAPEPAKGGWPVEHLEQDAGQAVEIAPAVEIALRAGLLGAHVGRRSHGKAAVGDVDVLAARGRDGGRDAEVGHDRLALLQQDVLRLDVAVHHVVAMGVAQRGGDRPGDAERRVDRERRLRCAAGRAASRSRRRA